MSVSCITTVNCPALQQQQHQVPIVARNMPQKSPQVIQEEKDILNGHGNYSCSAVKERLTSCGSTNSGPLGSVMKFFF